MRMKWKVFNFTGLGTHHPCNVALGLRHRMLASISHEYNVGCEITHLAGVDFIIDSATP